MFLLKRVLPILMFAILAIFIVNEVRDIRKRTDQFKGSLVIIRPISERFSNFERIRESLPPDATIAEVVAASDFVPSPEKLQAMSQVDLERLIKMSSEKSDELFAHVKTYTTDRLDFMEHLILDAKTPLKAHSDKMTLLRKGIRSAEYEYYAHKITFYRATKEGLTRRGGQKPINAQN